MDFSLFRRGFLRPWDGVRNGAFVVRPVPRAPQTLLVQLRDGMHPMSVCSIWNPPWCLHPRRSFTRLGERAFPLERQRAGITLIVVRVINPAVEGSPCVLDGVTRSPAVRAGRAGRRGRTVQLSTHPLRRRDLGLLSFLGGRGNRGRQERTGHLRRRSGQGGAGGGARTHTILRSLDFESSASASSATPARREKQITRRGPACK
jgi:hypothetical protein